MKKKLLFCWNISCKGFISTHCSDFGKCSFYLWWSPLISSWIVSHGEKKYKDSLQIQTFKKCLESRCPWKRNSQHCKCPDAYSSSIISETPLSWRVSSHSVWPIQAGGQAPKGVVLVKVRMPGSWGDGQELRPSWVEFQLHLLLGRWPGPVPRAFLPRSSQP